MRKVFSSLSNVIRMILFLIIMIFLSGALSGGFILLYGWISSFKLWWGSILLFAVFFPLVISGCVFIANLVIGFTLFLSPYRWYSSLVTFGVVIVQGVYSIHFAWTLKDNYDWNEIVLAIVATIVILWVNNIFFTTLKSFNLANNKI
jgi:hypothetical protein